MPANQATLGRLEAVLARLETVAAKLGIESVPKKGSAQSAADIQALVERLEAVADKIEHQSTPGAAGKYILTLEGGFNLLLKITSKKETRKTVDQQVFFVVLGSGKIVEFYDEVGSL